MELFGFFKSLKARQDDTPIASSETPTQLAARLIDQGNAAEEMGRTEDAMNLYDRAVLLAPSLARAQMNRGNILLAKGDAEVALAAYAKAIELDPNYAAAHYNAGNALANLGRHDAALTAYQQAALLKPEFADAHFALGCLLEDMGHFDDAITSYRDALKIRPDYAEVQANLGRALISRGHQDEGMASLQLATQRLPEDVGTLLLQGLVEKDRGHLEAARTTLSKVQAARPEDIEVNIHLGDTLLYLGQPEEAMICYRRVLETNQDHCVANNNMGNAYLRMGAFHEAAASYRRALAASPDSPSILSNLGGVLNDIGEPSEAIQCLRRAITVLPSYHMARSNLLFLSHLDEKFSQEALFEEAKAYGFVIDSKAVRSMTWSNARDPERRLRIGFVSGDLCFHPVGFFIEGILRALANRPSVNLEIFAYMNLFRIDSVGQRIKLLCTQWREIYGLTDEETARLVGEDEIDILFDLSGHSGGNRLPVFAWKPAPVQATWLGYFDTTGVDAIDYLIADPITLPESEEVFFTEKIWRLPNTRLCFTPPEIDFTIRPLPALSEGVITFGCFSSLAKMGNSVIALWARVLLTVPNSRLFLKNRQLYEPSMCEAVIHRFHQHGVDPARLILEGPESRTNYFAAYNRVDIGLDPFPYTGGTTTAESLWMGVPVLTLAGKHFLARQGEGLLMNAGLPDWVAAEPDDYVAKAVFHASNLERLAALHSSLREQVLASPIFDSVRFAMHFEEAVRGMWRAWCAGSHQPTPNRHAEFLNPLNSKRDAS